MEKIQKKIDKTKIPIPLILRHIVAYAARDYRSFVKSSRNRIINSVEPFYKPISKR